MKLKPVTVSVGGSFKTFGLRDGISSGSELTVTFEVPEGLVGTELMTAISLRKVWVDQFCLHQEYIKGMVPEELYREQVRRAGVELERLKNESS